MFKEALQRSGRRHRGRPGRLLDGLRGHPARELPKKGFGFDIETVGAEVSVVVKAIQRASEMLDAGPTKEVAFKSEKMVTLIRVLNDNYFVALTMVPDGNFGKGRFMLGLRRRR